jgi:hypothetical protein
VTTAAVVIGIDDYATQPLTSAVNDAHALSDALVAVDLVEAKDVLLLTAPPGPRPAPPTRKAILNALHPVLHR